jgi:hypothetical protein
MGTQGTNKFKDYPGTPRGGASGAKAGGPSSEDPGDVPLCERRLTGVPLEEVGRCDYFRAHSTIPAVGTPVVVRKKLVGGRIGVETTGGELIGFLPTDYNYLLRCMKQGYSYAGQVTSIAAKPIPVVRVDLESSK